MLFDSSADTWVVGLIAGRQMIPTTVKKEGERLFLDSGFSKILIQEFKQFAGAKWHGIPPDYRKEWSVTDNERNRFRLMYMAYPGKGHPNNPYNPYDCAVKKFDINRPSAYEHQKGIINFVLTRRQCIVAAEMGTGKTLSAIEVMENSGMDDWIWVGPKSANYSVQLEFKKWKSARHPRFYTYEALKRLLAEWPAGKKAPQGMIVDECSRCKNMTSQRTQCVRYLADNIRKEWGSRGFVVLMSGTPSPKSPVDWYSLAEIACPGFLREGTVEKFKQRLAIIAQREQFVGGGTYPHLVSWLDDEKKCKTCGLYEAAECHSSQEEVNVFGSDAACHVYEPSINEVHNLYERLKGLAHVVLKKDCLDLPEKQYEEVILQPSRSILNAERAIKLTAKNTMTALIQLRELSDGFQYVQSVEGTVACERCLGSRTMEERYDEVSPDLDFPEPQEIEKGKRFIDDGDSYGYVGPEIRIVTHQVACANCNGTGYEDKIIRAIKQVDCPKEDALRDIIDQHDDIGRLVVYGGFTGTIDRICSIVKSCGWNFIRVDGRGWVSDIPGDPQRLLTVFQEEKERFSKVVFIGHPSSAGMGLTLTASPSIVYYSNDFNGESRIQSEDRIHRAGMDVNRGAKIWDLLHLASDKLVLDNLKKKRRLQDLTMGELQSYA